MQSQLIIMMIMKIRLLMNQNRGKTVGSITKHICGMISFLPIEYVDILGLDYLNKSLRKNKKVPYEGCVQQRPIFKRENYEYWKEFIYVYLMSVNKILLLLSRTRAFLYIILKSIDDCILVEKSPKDLTDDETKQEFQYLKFRNTLIYTLNIDVYFSILYSKTSQKMWNALKVLNKAIEDGK